MSTKEALSEWAKLKTVKPQASDLEKQAATEAREQGNKCFSEGDLLQAEGYYTRSLSISPTKEAFANRALTRIKLGKFEDAKEDCDNALQIDQRFVKARARRALALSKLGDHRRSLQDFIEAEKLSPNDEHLRKEREREEAIIAAYNSVAPQELDNEILPKEPQVSDPSPNSVTEVSPVKNHANDLNLKSLNNILQRAHEAVRQPSSSPTNLSAFEKTWRNLSLRRDLRREMILQQMGKEDFRRCFDQVLEPELLFDLLDTCDTGDELLHVLSLLSTLSSFSLARLMLSKDQKQELELRMNGDQRKQFLHFFD